MEDGGKSRCNFSLQCNSQQSLPSKSTEEVSQFQAFVPMSQAQRRTKCGTSRPGSNPSLLTHCGCLWPSSFWKLEIKGTHFLGEEERPRAASENHRSYSISLSILLHFQLVSLFYFNLCRGIRTISWRHLWWNTGTRQVEAESGNRRLFTHKQPEHPIPNVPISMGTIWLKLLL